MQIPQNLAKTNEVRDKRNLNSKFYLVSDQGGIKTYKMCASTGHQHYMNKMGVGDGQIRWRELDWTLQWDNVKRGWYFNFHSFNPFLPEYADQWIEFRDLFDGKDQTVRYKAQCGHVLGRKVANIPGLTDMNAVIYDDAFGVGQDLILYFTRSTLKKVVRIREGFYANAEQRFKFEVDLPNKKIVRATDKDTIAYELDTTLPKTFDTAKQTLIGDDTGDGKEWYTYMRDFKAWDNNSQTNISVDYTTIGSQKFIEKIIPASFLNTATGDVYTDTTTSYSAAAGDGRTARTNVSESWATIIAGAGTWKNNIATSHWLNFNQASTTTDQWGNSNHSFFPIDTSGIDDAATVTAATMKLYYKGTSGDSLGIANNDNSRSVLIDGAQASTSSLAFSDHQGMGNVDFGRSAQQAAITTAGVGYFNIALNASGLSFINKTGFSKFGTKMAADFDAIAPVWVSQGWTSLSVYQSEDAGTTRDPFIEVTFSLSVPSFTPKTMVY